MANYHDLNATELDLLTTLGRLDQEAPATTRAIREDLEAHGRDSMAAGVFYPSLDVLQAEGVVDKREDPEDSRRNVYELTDEGRDLVISYAADTAEALIALTRPTPLSADVDAEEEAEDGDETETAEADA